MPRCKFIRRANIENRDQAIASSLQQFLPRDGFHRIALGEITSDNPVDFGKATFGDLSQRREQRQDCRVSQPVDDVFSIPSRSHKSSATQLLKMLGRICDRKPGSLRQCLNAAFTLGQVLQKLQTVCVPHRFGHQGKLQEERVLGTLA